MNEKFSQQSFYLALFTIAATMKLGPMTWGLYMKSIMQWMLPCEADVFYLQALVELQVESVIH